MNDRIPLDKCVRFLRARARGNGHYSPYGLLATQLRNFERFIPEDRAGLRAEMLRNIKKIEAEK